MFQIRHPRQKFSQTTLLSFDNFSHSRNCNKNRLLTATRTHFPAISILKSPKYGDFPPFPYDFAYFSVNQCPHNIPASNLQINRVMSGIWR